MQNLAIHPGKQWLGKSRSRDVSRAKKEALIRGDFDALVELSKSKRNPHVEPVEARE
jgi:hypothetical protein